ncbi:MAG TPA: ABC transporter substrate-binding protein [Candidatus Limnocylindrales bacterium]|nr:ABC transporter substrate-binding protein [Candidatus Limnocylindrales bacterium]
MITRRDQAIVGALVLALVAVGTVIAQPVPAPVVSAPESTPLPTVEVPTYREGILGRPVTVTPLTARTRAERTLVGLLFSGLTRIGPDGLPRPDLAATWSSSEGGKVWTFRIRPDVTWHDGTPVTAADVVYTVSALKDPDAPGPAAASWAEVTARAVDDLTVRFTLTNPLSAVPEAASQPLLPAHLLADVPVAELADDPFNEHPIGTGPYTLEALDVDVAYLESTALHPPVQPSPSAEGNGLATVAPGSVSDVAVPYLPRIELHFFEDPVALEDAFRAGEVHVASGLPTGDAAALAADVDDGQVIRYPSTTLTAVLLDQRPTHAELRDARVRRALLGALDRDALILGPLGGGGLRADVPYPPTAPHYDPDVVTRVAFDVEAATKLLTEAAWTKGEGGWIAPGRTDPYRIELLTPTAEVNPSVHAVATAIAAAWTSFGIGVDVVELDPIQLGTRLEDGTFGATVVDIRLGADLDLYPLLASSQSKTGGGNVTRYQDPGLDVLLAEARSARGAVARRAAVEALLTKLAADVPVLPLAWRDDSIAVQGIDGVLPRLIVDVGDRFSDVLSWRLASDR